MTRENDSGHKYGILEVSPETSRFGGKFFVAVFAAERGCLVVYFADANMIDTATGQITSDVTSAPT